MYWVCEARFGSRGGNRGSFWEKKPKVSPMTNGASASWLLDPSLAKADLSSHGGSDEL